MTYHVKATWDEEAEVWFAISEDVPGLTTEAETIEALLTKLRVMIPELLDANGVAPTPAGEVLFQLTTERSEVIRHQAA